MTAGASRPARAMRHGIVLLIIAAALRSPTIEHEFADAIAAGEMGWKPFGSISINAQPITAMVTTASKMPAPVSPNLAGTRTSPPHGSERHIAPAPSTRVLPTIEFIEEVDAPALNASTPAVGHIVPPVTAIAAGLAKPEPGALATMAYIHLAAGNRRAAVYYFDAALAGSDPQAGMWRKQRDQLTRRWSANAYSLVRASGDMGLVGAPLLGGSQSGISFGFSPDPLSSRPLTLKLRGGVDHVRGEDGFAAVGIEWRPFTPITLAVEQISTSGRSAHHSWAVRASGGTEQNIGALRLVSYAEGGLIGDSPYAAGQVRAAVILHRKLTEIAPGFGVWASLQHDRKTIDRVDVGPGVVGRIGPLAVEVDYRFRIAGNASPGSGPVLTASVGF